MAEGERDGTRRVSISAILSIVGAVVTIGVTAANFYFGARKTDFDSGNTIATLYFDGVGTLPDQVERHCPQLRFAAFTAVAMSGLQVRELDAEFERGRERLRAAQAMAAVGEATTEAAETTWRLPTLQEVVPAVARVVYADMRERWTQSCEARCPWPGPDGQVVCATVLAQATTGTAAPRPEPAPPPPAAGPDPRPPAPPPPELAPRPAPQLSPPYTVYIQYLRDSAAGRDEARELQARIGALAAPRSFVAPGTEGVQQVPARNEIRIYRDADRAAAERLAAELGLSGFRIVNIAAALPNRRLPERVMELWLAAR